MITKILSFGLLTFMIVDANPMSKGFPQFPGGNSINPEIAIPRKENEQRVYYFEETTEINEKGNNYIEENLKDLVPMTNNRLGNDGSQKRPINLEEEFEIIEKPRKPKQMKPQMEKRFGETTVEDSQYGIKDGPTGYEPFSDEHEHHGSDEDFDYSDNTIDGRNHHSHYPHENPGFNAQTFPQWLPSQVFNSASNVLGGPAGQVLFNTEVQHRNPRLNNHGNQDFITGTVDNVLHNVPYLGKNSNDRYRGQSNQPIHHPVGKLFSTGMAIPNYVADTGNQLFNFF